MGNEIKAKDFFDEILKEIKNDKNTKITDLNNYFENCEDINVAIPILQKTNEYFLKNYEIHLSKDLLKFDKDLIIRPIETEIYFSKIHKDNTPADDGMCHMNDLQKGFVKDTNGENKERFGKLYFHRHRKKDKNDVSNKIKYDRGGVDVCISNSEKYYLSILIRGAYINGELFCGINKIMKEILEVTKENLNCIEEEKVLFPREDGYKNQEYFIYQNRIISGKYSIDGMPLNIIINAKKIFDEIDKENDNIVSSVRTHYRYIKAKDFESKKNILISLSLKSIIHSIL